MSSSRFVTWHGTRTKRALRQSASGRFGPTNDANEPRRWHIVSFGCERRTSDHWRARARARQAPRAQARTGFRSACFPSAGTAARQGLTRKESPMASRTAAISRSRPTSPSLFGALAPLAEMTWRAQGMRHLPPSGKKDSLRSSCSRATRRLFCSADTTSRTSPFRWSANVIVTRTPCDTRRTS